MFGLVSRSTDQWLETEFFTRSSIGGSWWEDSPSQPPLRRDQDFTDMKLLDGLTIAKLFADSETLKTSKATCEEVS